MTEEESTYASIGRKVIRVTILVSLINVLLIGAADPVAAGSSSSSSSGTGFCDINYVGSLVNAAFSIFVGGALALGLLTWVATSFTESLPLPQDTKKSIQQQRNSGIAAAMRAVFVPALILTLLSATSIGIPSCITVLP